MIQPRTQPNRGYMTVGVWVIATTAIAFGLYVSADILAPFALAIFVWLVMEALARSIRKPLPKLPVWMSHVLAVAIVVVSVIIFIGVLRGAVVEFAGKSDLYEARINTLIERVYAMLGLDDAPKLSALIFSGATVRFVEPALASVQGLAGDLFLILIYVGFLYLSSTTFSRKLDNIFLDFESRERARLMGIDVRRTMEQYLWVQTVLSIITTLLTYITMLGLGLDNALFWAFVIFFLNYIPTIGSFIAPVLPALFAIAQPDWPGYMPDDPMWCALAVFIGVSVWQFAIGNFVGPRMTSDSLNISALVVLLSLAIWGALWGLPGMFLSAPLTVLVMILLAQVPGARWIAILLSADGNPGGRPASLPADLTSRLDGKARHDTMTIA
ncbi:MAG: AI-2E family transporter [Alphaproteobacteria bacterium]|nr:AI-2E family transporter [Alphaproteobacteria bacterium]